jgi:predicted anti-sigma-YlaC factor YlaD
VEHLTQKQNEDYAHNRLGGAELLTLSDHLAECESCRKQMDSNGETSFFALHADVFAEDGSAPGHLSPEQTAEYVDKNLSGDELRMVADHLSGCEQCEMAVSDLRGFRNAVAPSLDRDYAPAASVSQVVERSWRQRFASVLRTSPVPAFGGAVLAVLVLVFVGWMVWRTPRQENNEVAAASPTPTQQPEPSIAPTTQPEAVPPVLVVAQLNDGSGTLTLDRDGKLSGADNLPAEYQIMVKKALNGQRIEKSPQLQGLTRPSSSLMGSNDESKGFSVIEPAGSVVMTDRPVFRWSKLEGATSYVVEVYDDQFKLVASSLQIPALSWTTPQSLARGHVYAWQVKASKDGQEITSPRPPAPQAKFRVLDQAKASELSRAKRTYASSHLTLALLYADAGLLKEAEQELRLLRRSNPNSDIPRKLLRQLQEFGHR